MWCPESKKVIQSRDVIFNETSIFTFGMDFVVPSIGVGDQEDIGIEIKVKTVVAQGGAANQPNREAQVTEPSAISSNLPQVEVAHSIARDSSRREIRRPARYNDDEGLIAYVLSVA